MLNQSDKESVSLELISENNGMKVYEAEIELEADDVVAVYYEPAGYYYMFNMSCSVERTGDLSEDATVYRTQTGADIYYTPEDTDNDGKIDSVSVDHVAPNGAVSVTIPEYIKDVPVRVIKTDAFCGLDAAYHGLQAEYNCSGVKEIVIPETVTKIESQGIHWCRNLQRVYLRGENCEYKSEFLSNGDSNPVGIKLYVREKYRSVYYDLLSAYTVLVEDDVIEDNQGFRYISRSDGSLAVCDYVNIFDEISIPSDYTGKESKFAGKPVTAIAEMAFSGCGFKKVIIPESVTEIGNSAFRVCEKLESLTILNKKCTINDLAVGNGMGWTDYSYLPYFNGVIYGKQDSTAQEFANSRGFEFSALETEEDGIRFISRYVILRDGITVNFKVGLGSDSADIIKGAVVKFKSDCTDTEVSFADADCADNEYSFRIPVRPDNMTDEITAQIIFADGTKGDSVNFTVREYLDELVENPDYKGKYDQIAEAILTYGARAQKYTGYRTDNLADDSEANHGSQSVSIGSEYKAQTEYSGSSVKAKSALLELGGNTSIKIKFETDGSSWKANCKNPETGEPEVIETETVGNTVIITLKDIRPQDLDVMYEFSVVCGDSSATVKFSAFTYMKQILESNSSPDDLTGLVRALYDLNTAAENLIGEENDYGKESL